MHAAPNKFTNPIYTFCSKYIDPQPDDKGDWLDQRVVRSSLNHDIMYLWLHRYGGPEGDGIHFFYVPFATISDYATWDDERFSTELTKIAEKY